MTDKIIIDGVDVSGCDYCLNNKLKGKGHAPSKSMPYAKETSCIECKTNSTKYNFCKHNPNCHYKQLKRLEAENERLKQQLAEIGKSWGEIQRLRKEKENLIEQLVIYNQFENSYNNYKQFLQEIKEIAENAKRDICNNCGWRNTESCDPEDYTCGEFIKILQLITKAEEE